MKHNESNCPLALKKIHRNFYSDLNHNRLIDLIYSYMEDAGNFYSFKETRIERMELQVVKKDSIIWGTYLGHNYDGNYAPD